MPPTLTLPPLFIIGSPRSGTTMLAGLLHDSPWGTPIETHFITKYYRLARSEDLSNRDAFRRITRRILSERPILQRGLNLDPDALYDSMSRYDYAHLVDQIGLAYARQQGHISWGDKTPHYITEVELLHNLFPSSRMIYIVRDGRDVARSLMARSWGPATIYGCAEQWRRENEPKPVFDGMRSRGLLHEIRYEDLLQDPERKLSDILTFLGLARLPISIRQTVADVQRANRDKWKVEMSARDAAIFERIAGNTLRRFGYTVTHDPEPIAPMRAAGYRAQDAYKHFHNLFMMNVVDTVKIRFLGKEPFAG